MRSYGSWRVGVICVALLMLEACAHKPTVLVADPPGLLYGALHGSSPLALIASLFADVRIYAFPNIKAWYDFGFVLGISSLIGGVASSQRAMSA